jgi:hypothetical protein
MAVEPWKLPAGWNHERCCEHVAGSVAVVVGVLGHRSKVRDKLMAFYRSMGRCISTSERTGSPRPAVNMFI